MAKTKKKSSALLLLLLNHLFEFKFIVGIGRVEKTAR